MANQDLEIQLLYKKIGELEAENIKLKEMHYADMAQIVYQRRQIDFLMDSAREREDKDHG